MDVQISGVDGSSRLAIEHIVKLFFEDPIVTFTDQMPEQHSTGLSEEVRIVLGGGPAMMRRWQLDADIAEGDAGRKQRKRQVAAAVLELLREHTGIDQPWGILTGVRPTKLVHQKARAGLDRLSASRELAEDLLVHPEKIALLQTIADRQLAALPDLYSLGREVSIYIGIPFCPTKCAYCTFPAYAIGGRQGSVDSFLSGLHYEIREVGRWLKENGIGITTVYFGGGTPTSITAEEMDRLYDEMYRSFPDPDAIREVTVEAGRPDTITPEKLEVLKKWNIDRISINPQSYTQETLNAIGRHHSALETVEKYWLARSMGMTNINMDLIIGLPGEGIREFTHTLEVTAGLMPESLTIHTLSFKRASEMTHNKDRYPVAGREEAAAMMKLGAEWCGSHGYHPYYLYRQKNILGNMENVGYSKPGKESLYNILIMEEMQSIVGLGCGASSKWVHPVTGEIGRFANPKEPKAYNDSFLRCTEAKIEALNELFGTGQNAAQR